MPRSLVTCIAVTEINRSVLPLPMTLVKLGLSVQAADFHCFKTDARFNLLLWRLTKSIMLEAVAHRFYWGNIKLWSQAEPLTLGFQLTGRNQQPLAEEMSKCYESRDTQEKQCLLVRVVLDLATYYVGQSLLIVDKIPQSYNMHNMAYTMDVIRAANLEYWQRIFDFSNPSVNLEA